MIIIILTTILENGASIAGNFSHWQYERGRGGACGPKSGQSD